MLAGAATAKQPVPAWEVERVLQATYKAVAERLLRVVVGEQGLLDELQVYMGMCVCVERGIE